MPPSSWRSLSDLTRGVLSCFVACQRLRRAHRHDGGDGLTMGTCSTPMGVTADRLLRLMVACRQPVTDYSLDTLKVVARAAEADSTSDGGQRRPVAGKRRHDARPRI